MSAPVRSGFEDLHWADLETLAVLEYVIDHALEEQLPVVATARPGSSAGGNLVRDPPDRELVHLAALLERLDPALLGPAVGRPPDEVAGVLARCVELQLVARDGAAFRFRHALTRDAVLAGLHPQVCAVLALRARNVLATLHPGLPRPWCELAAELSLLGGDIVGAARLLLTAAQRAVAVGALVTAAAVLGQARDLAPDGSDLLDDIDELRTEVSARSGDVNAAFGIGDRGQTPH